MLGKRPNKPDLSYTVFTDHIWRTMRYWYNEIPVYSWCLEISSLKNVAESGKRNRERRRWKEEGGGGGRGVGEGILECDVHVVMRVAISRYIT